MSQQVIALWNEADGHQAAGRLAEAERCFRAVAELTGDNPHPLDRLAQVLRGQGRLEEAWAEASRAIAGEPMEPVFHNTAAGIADALGDAHRAENHYRRALLLAPELALWPSLASARLRAGNHHGAIEAYRNALVLIPGDIGLMFERAVAHHGAGETAEAACRYRAVLGQAPGHAPTLRNLAVLASEVGDEAAAMTWLRKALVADPASVALTREMGVKALNSGEVARAFTMHRRAIRLDPSESISWGALSDAGRRLDPDRPDSGGLRDLVACMVEGIVSPHRLIGPMIALLRQEPGFIDACRDAASTPPEALAERLVRGGVPAAFDNDALLDPLRLSLLPDPDIEIGLTALRSALLEMAARDLLEVPEARAWDRLILALAEQCQLNEHVWLETAEDTARVAALTGRLAGETHWSRAALVLACFRVPTPRDPLDDAGFARFEELHVAARERERFIAEGLPTLTPIDDPVSRAVRAQYEENPYPRWTRLPAAHAWRDGDDEAGPREVLIAGCGTGQHALLAAARYDGANILAVDLSRASLAYAERKRVEHGAGNVTFAQADLLRLGSLERRFDVIESIGVLHHMANPLDGWKVLTGLLAPGGVMRIGLYSEIARQAVVRARELIAEWGLGDSASAIREARRRLIRDHAGVDLAALFVSPDFFGLSTCRDLLFHVQEHRFTIPELRAAMETLELEFLGFDTPSVTMANYQARFTDDPRGLNLAHWEVFEHENPGCFGAMYQFRVARR
jgi:tetratricopeptide (TPR) repeat protein/SAM-dependent methyltransferase